MTWSKPFFTTRVSGVSFHFFNVSFPCLLQRDVSTGNDYPTIPFFQYHEAGSNAFTVHFREGQRNFYSLVCSNVVI
jgi:hypothetical protein